MAATFVIGTLSEIIIDTTGFGTSEPANWTFFLVAALLIGYVGGVNRNWRITMLGIFAFGACVYTGGLYDELLDVSNDDYINWRWTVLFAGITMFAPATLSHYCSERWWGLPLPGHCQVCGYNLTGLTKPRCPECGFGFTCPNEHASSEVE
jgi:hypothetical protein